MSARIAQRVRTNETKLISVTCPHNPTGTMLDRTDLDALVEVAERSGAVLLVDETYRDLTHGELLPMAASLSRARDLGVVNVESVRAARVAGGLGRLPRPAAPRDATGRQGADGDLRRDDR